MFTRHNAHPTAVFAFACVYSELHLLLPLRGSLGRRCRRGSCEVAACSSAMVTASCSAGCQRAPSLPSCERKQVLQVPNCGRVAWVSFDKSRWSPSPRTASLFFLREERGITPIKSVLDFFFFFNSKGLKNVFSLEVPPSVKLLSCSAV